MKTVYLDYIHPYTQYSLRVLAFDLRALGVALQLRFMEQTEAVSKILSDCSVVISEVSNAPKSKFSGAMPRTPLGELTALPQTH